MTVRGASKLGPVQEPRGRRLGFCAVVTGMNRIDVELAWVAFTAAGGCLEKAGGLEIPFPMVESPETPFSMV